MSSITCSICPHLCNIAENHSGLCGVRRNNGSYIELSSYDKFSILSVEPIEKRPFFHFDVGSRYLSAGWYGCNFSCLYCQNYTVSQSTDGKYKVLNPSQLVTLAKEKKCNGIAFTFNEPTIYFEYLMDIGDVKSDLNIVMKTNGFVSKDVLSELVTVIDAFNVDVKGDDEEYKKVCNGSLPPVLSSIETLYNHGKHLEISYLVTPRMLKNRKYHEEMLEMFADMPEVPIHFLYFYPFHKMTDVSYCVHDLISLVDKFKNKLKYVYLSNVYKPEYIDYRNTHCPDCNNLMISRSKGVGMITNNCCNNFLTRA